MEFKAINIINNQKGKKKEDFSPLHLELLLRSEVVAERRARVAEQTRPRTKAATAINSSGTRDAGQNAVKSTAALPWRHDSRLIQII